VAESFTERSQRRLHSMVFGWSFRATLNNEPFTQAHWKKDPASVFQSRFMTGRL
jgi:hypothetical protein